MDLDNPQVPVSPGYARRDGSITGFTQIIDDTLTSILTRGWSKEQLHQAILNLREQTGSAGLQQLLTLLTEHLLDFNNPHNVTAAQVSSDVLAQLLRPVLPGTPPSTPPIFGLRAELQADMAFLPYTYSGGTDQTGAWGFQEPNGAGFYHKKTNPNPPNGIRAGRAVIPMVTGLSAAPKGLDPTLLAGTGNGAVPGTSMPAADGQTYTGYVADGTAPNTVGFSGTFDGDNGGIYTGSYVFVVATATKRLRISRGASTIIVDVATGTASSSSPNSDVGDAEILPNGLVRIIHTFIHQTGVPLVFEALASSSDDAPTPFPENQAGFALSTIEILPTAGAMPPLSSGLTSLSQSKLTLNIPDVLEDDVMVSMTLFSLPFPSRGEVDIFVFGGITVSVTALGYKIRTNTGTVYFTQTTQNSDFVTLAFSLSKSRLTMKFTGEDKLVVPGDFTSLIPRQTSFDITNFLGDIRDVTVYAESDRDDMLGFLVDG